MIIFAYVDDDAQIARLERTRLPSSEVVKLSTIHHLFSLNNPQGRLLLSYRTPDMTANAFGMELSVAPGWKEMPWIVLAQNADYPAALDFQREYAQVERVLVAPVSEETLAALWIEDRPSHQAAPVLPMTKNQNELMQERLIQCGATDYFQWDRSGTVVDVSGNAARALSAEMQFSLSLADKMSKDCDFGDLLELHAIGPSTSAALFSVQPDAKSADSLRIVGFLLKSSNGTAEFVTQARAFTLP